jgi:hypothetical protein
MTSLDRGSERYNATGGMSAEGMGNQLGRPALDRLAILVREAVQNSWDAKSTKSNQVRFEVELRRLLKPEKLALVKTILADRPAGPADEEFERVLDLPQDISLLTIRDSGTSGLGGPTRADDVPKPNQPTDFVDFIRNVGQAPDKKLSGGTYGYGKAVLYRTSEIGTILVYSRSREGDRHESRFLACAWGAHFDIARGANRGRYTGRHWWGRRSLDGVVDPLLDSEADEAAGSIGLKPFAGAETGTCLAIIAPRLGERTRDEAMAYVARSLLWHCWPKLMPGDNATPAMAFSVQCDGRPIQIDSPASLEPLRHFATAKSEVQNARTNAAFQSGHTIIPIRCQRPVKLLGHLALVRFASNAWSTALAAGDDSPVQVPVHHVALMRNAELVVKYLPGPANPVGEIAYCGVFIPRPDVDEAFAKSEPPTHDDWQPSELDPGPQKTFVNVALRRISEAVKEFVAPIAVSTPTQAQAPLGGLSDALGSLVSGQDSFGPGLARQAGPSTGARSGSSGATRTKGPRIAQDRPPQLVLVRGAPALAFEFAMQPAPASQTTRITATPRIGVLDAVTVEVDPPAGAPVPRVVGWELQGKAIESTEPSILVAGSELHEGRVFVSAFRDASVGLDLVAEIAT